MAIRTTSDSVKGLLLHNYDVINNPSLTPFIATASVLVDRISTAGLADTTLLELLERWLAAHYYAVSDPAYKQDQRDSSSGTYEGQTGYGLMSTRYGQQALALDTTGTLQKLAGKDAPGVVKISGHYVGKDLDNPARTETVWAQSARYY